MSRVIKMRAWRSSQQRMYLMDVFMCNWSLGEIKTAKEDILMQFTGLLDKNGVEIYEGDIVRTVYDPSHLPGATTEVKEDIMVVEHDSCNPCFVMVSPKNSNRVEYDFVVCGMRKNEVIGNIHQHPHLLEGGKNG